MSHVLERFEQQGLLIKQFVYALLIASQKSLLYLGAHRITILTEQPLQNNLKQYKSSGRMVKWVVELALYGISYESRRAIKAQALADLLSNAQFCISERKEKVNYGCSIEMVRN